MRRHCTDEDAGAWEDFQKSGSSLRGWIDGEAARLKSPVEQQLLKQMVSVHESYIQKAFMLHSMMSTNNSRTGATVAEFNQFLDQARQFMDLSQQLGRAHFDSRNDLIGRASRTLTELRMSVLVLLGMWYAYPLWRRMRS